MPSTASGTTASMINVSRHAITEMMTMPPTNMTMFESRLSSTSVTAFWIVVTSLPSRESRSPVRVAAKKLSGMFWRWAYRVSRRLATMRSPTQPMM